MLSARILKLMVATVAMVVVTPIHDVLNNEISRNSIGKIMIGIADDNSCRHIVSHNQKKQTIIFMIKQPNPSSYPQTHPKVTESLFIIINDHGCVIGDTIKIVKEEEACEKNMFKLRYPDNAQGVIGRLSDDNIQHLRNSSDIRQQVFAGFLTANAARPLSDCLLDQGTIMFGGKLYKTDRVLPYEIYWFNKSTSYMIMRSEQDQNFYAIHCKCINTRDFINYQIQGMEGNMHTHIRSKRLEPGCVIDEFDIELEKLEDYAYNGFRISFTTNTDESLILSVRVPRGGSDKMEHDFLPNSDDKVVKTHPTNDTDESLKQCEEDEIQRVRVQLIVSDSGTMLNLLIEELTKNHQTTSHDTKEFDLYTDELESLIRAYQTYRTTFKS